jgi:hypothetical protein
MRGQSVKPDVYGGALFVAIGVGAMVLGGTYGVGSPTHMGAGFFPFALGCVTGALGTVLILETLRPSLALEASPIDNVGGAVGRHEWRGFGAIVAGILTFIVLGKFFGLAPAAFGCVFVSALGDRAATIKSAAILAATTSVFAVVFFSYVLGVQFPVFQLAAFGSGP